MRLCVIVVENGEYDMNGTSGLDYYVAKPKSGKGRPVMLMHPWWGLNGFIKQFCVRLAGEGFFVLAPDLYRGPVALTIEEAQALGSAADARFEEIKLEVVQYAEELKMLSGASEIGVVALSLGGYYSLWLSSQPSNPIAAAVMFYATGEFDYAHSHAAYQFHLAAEDVYEPPENAEKTGQSLAAAGKAAEFHTYEGTKHWFFESNRPEYDAAAAQSAWDRTVEFLKAHVGEP
jgi:carboxymethylenebutenolidase